ncbi:MAG: signal peptidase II [Deltaproteobacteria bacterium]|nr:signal peptidase II [Deltaproteobacteria bacterium]
MRGRTLVFATVLLLAVGCDQATKQLAVERLEGAPPISLAGDAVRFQLAANTGGFLSLGDGLPPVWRRVVFVGLVPACLLVVCALVLRSREVSAAAMVGLGLVVGGGLGNWLDRVGAGAVTDFVSLGIGPLRTGVFNLADVAIVAGVLLLALVRSEGERPEP